MKPQVFGVCQHSVTTFYDCLVEEMEKFNLDPSNISMVENHTTLLPRSEILFFVDFNSLYNHRDKIAKRKSLVFVVDTLPQLYGIEGLKFLDVDEPKEGFSYVFKPHPLDLSSIRKSLSRLVNGKLVGCNIKAEKFEIIPPLVDMIKNGMILDKLNNIVYRTPDPVKRDKIRRELIEYLVGSQSLTDCYNNLKSMFRKGLAFTYVEQLNDFLKSDKGKAYKEALTFIHEYKGKTPLKMEKVAEKFLVERSEVRYLSRLMKTTLKKPVMETGILHDIKSIVQPKRLNKEGRRG